MLLSTKTFFKKNVSNCNNTINDDKFNDVDFIVLKNSLRREWLDSYSGVRYTLTFLFLSDVEEAEEQLLQAILMKKLNRDAVDKRGTAWRFGKREDASNLLQGVKDLLSKTAAGDKDDTDAAHGDYDSYKEDQLLRYLGHDEVGYNNEAEEKRGSAWRFG